MFLDPDTILGDWRKAKHRIICGLEPKFNLTEWKRKKVSYDAAERKKARGEQHNGKEIHRHEEKPKQGEQLPDTAMGKRKASVALNEKRRRNLKR